MMTGPPKFRHPLHRQNGNGQAEIAAAFLLLEFDDIDQERCWRHRDPPEDDCVAVPIALWASVVQLSRRVVSLAREMPAAVSYFARALQAVPQKNLYHMRTQEVMLPIMIWADLVKARQDAGGPWAVKAYATEYYIRNGTFPGGRRGDQKDGADDKRGLLGEREDVLPEVDHDRAGHVEEADRGGGDGR